MIYQNSISDLLVDPDLLIGNPGSKMFISL